MRLKGMNIQAAMGRPTAAEPRRVPAAGVAISELRALQSADLVAGPEFLEDALTRDFSASSTVDLDRLGPLKSGRKTQQQVLRSLGRFVRATEQEAQPVSTTPGDVVKEAKLRAVVEQIYNMRTLIRDSQIKRS